MKQYTTLSNSKKLTKVLVSILINCEKKVEREKGQVLCEGYATENGELALGRNMKVAFILGKGITSRMRL